MAQKKMIRKKIRKDIFDQEGLTPSFKDVSRLKKFISERGRILGRDKTGLSSKNQRKLTVAVKRARLLALLPFVTHA